MAVAAAGSLNNARLGFTPTQSSTATLGGTTIGYLEGDINLSVPHETAFLRNGLVPIDAVTVSRDMMISLAAKEILLGNMQYAWNTDAPTSTAITLDSDTGASVALLVNTYAPNGLTGERVVSMPKAISVGDGAYTLPQATAGGDNHQTLTMEFQAIGDTTSNGLLGTITDTYA